MSEARPISKFTLRAQYVWAGLLWVSSSFFRRNPAFSFQGGTFPYFHHRYNFTWLNERIVEIPLARQVLQQFAGRRILEVGNVLSHYFPELRHPVIDKYEKSSDPRILQEDGRYFQPDSKYDLIISLSTLEHVGWDEIPIELGKALETIRHLRTLLSDDGVFIFTIPVGYHPCLDRSLSDGMVLDLKLYALRRNSITNEWNEAASADVLEARFGSKYPFANAILIGIVGNSQAISWTTKVAATTR